MSRCSVLVLLLLLSGCCTTGTDERNLACEAALADSRDAAERGWENIRHGLSPQPHPTLHEGMTAREVENELGAPSRKRRDQNRERWVYPKRAMVVLVKEGKVVGWKQ